MKEEIEIEVTTNEIQAEAKDDQMLKGQPGDRGPPGEKGEQGPEGKQGKQGIPGEKGESGKQGEKGVNGKDGKPGKQGDKGKQGKTGESSIGVPHAKAHEKKGDDKIIIENMATRRKEKDVMLVPDGKGGINWAKPKPSEGLSDHGPHIPEELIIAYAVTL